jgi:hypothetical protein
MRTVAVQRRLQQRTRRALHAPMLSALEAH